MPGGRHVWRSDGRAHIEARGITDPDADELRALDVLCFDKTGTLTEGRIAVESVSDGDKMEPLDGLSPRRRAVLGAALRALRRQIRVRAITTGGAATGAWAAARMTGTTGRASAVALLALVGAQLGQTLTAGKGNRLVTATGLGSAAVLAGIVQTPGISHFFGCRPVGPIGWLQAGTASVLATGAAAVAAEPRPTEDHADRGSTPSDGERPIPAAHGECTVVS